MRYQKSVYLYKYKEQLYRGEKYTTSKTSTSTDSNFPTERECKGKLDTLGILFPFPLFFGKTPEIAVARNSRHAYWIC